MLIFIVASLLLGVCITPALSWMAMNTESTPRTPYQTNLLSTSNALKLTGASLGGYALKQFLDGPNYTDLPGILSGKNIVITGANTGLGKESAVVLAKLGADITLLCRNNDKAQAAIDEIKVRANIDDSKIRNIVCDLNDLKSIDQASDQVKKSLSKVDVLMNNAGKKPTSFFLFYALFIPQIPTLICLSYASLRLFLFLFLIQVSWQSLRDRLLLKGLRNI